jgi:hypothetical protein
LIGHDSGRAVVTAHWIDTWHMGEKVMACNGTTETDGSINERGSHAISPWQK